MSFTPDDLLRQAENNSIISENQRGAEIAMLEWAAQRVTELEGELEQFSKWAQRCGHYQVVGLIENYRRFREET